MAAKNKASPKEIYEIHIKSAGEKEIKQILKEILLKKSRHICISQGAEQALKQSADLMKGRQK